MEATGVSGQMAQRIISRFATLQEKWFACINDSFISDNQKERFKALISNRIATLSK